VIQKSFLALAALVALIPARAHASEGALSDTLDILYALPEILVEARRLRDTEDLRSRPGFVAILPLESEGRRLAGAADHLARAVGCHVRSTGGYGAYSTASIRGSSAKQVRVFLDGVPLNSAQTGLVDLADIPTASLARVEVYRGFGPYDLSGSSMGGVVNLVTRKPEGRGGRLGVTYGSLHTMRFHGSYGLRRDAWDVLLLGSGLTTEGDFEFLDDNGTPYTTRDDELVRRLNNQVEEYEGLIKATGPLSGGTLAASGQVYYRRQGLPGYSACQSLTERMTKSYGLFHLAWTRRLPARFPLKVTAGAFYRHQTDFYEDTGDRSGSPDERNHSRTYGASVRWDLGLRPVRQDLRGMLTFERETYRPDEIRESTDRGEEQKRDRLVVTLEDELRLLGGRLLIVPGGRYERYTDRITPFRNVRADLAAYFRGMSRARTTCSRSSGRISLIAILGLGLSLEANYGRHYRIPSFMELYGYRGMVLPNPTLEAEDGLNRDIGLGWDGSLGPAGDARLEAVRFESDA
jgi:iron complex outermembrane receptor protein